MVEKKYKSEKVPQFRDSVYKIISRHKLSYRQIINLSVYYGVAKYLPWGIGTKVRTFLCRRIFKFTGKDVTVLVGVSFGSGINIKIGDYSSLNRDCWISNDTIIGSNVMMGPEVIMLSGSHNFHRTDIPMREQGAPPRKPILIGDDVWIGTRAIILPGVKIGSHSIIGAGSIVTKDVPEWAIITGNPAKLIKYRKEPVES